MTIPSQAALVHLRSIKPNDGWSVQKDDNNTTPSTYKLYRRNVPLSDTSFLDIHYDSKQNVVVGVLTEDGKTCQVLVDEEGKPVSGARIVSVSTYTPGSAAKNLNLSSARSNPKTATSSTSNASTSRPRSVPTTESSSSPASLASSLTPEQNKELLKYGLMIIGFFIVARILENNKLLYILGLIGLYYYMIQTCPSIESFDAKKELKRVLRGHHLPEDHPDKPKGYFEKMAARVAATVATEMATMPGYEVAMIPIQFPPIPDMNIPFAAIVVDVRIPTSKQQCFWVGAFGKWHYVYGRELPSSATRYD